MPKISLFLVVLSLTISGAQAAPELRATINLKGEWDFDQTQTAFPPQEFTRKIPVPGLIHLANPPIEQFDVLYTKNYQPRYNWYRIRFTVPAELQGTQATLTLLKSMYVTQAYVNGMDVGTSIACYTPVEFPVASAIQFGKENELLVKVGDRAWLPSAAAGSTDKEKVAYLPGIWDDVSISFTGPFRAHRVLTLPSIKENKVAVKLQIRNFYPAQIQYGDPMEDSCEAQVVVREKKSGQPIGEAVKQTIKTKRDAMTECAIDVPMPNAHLWTPDDPFLYTAQITLVGKSGVSDCIEVNFGVREFGRNGRYFTLNGKKIILRGTNITLHRFFEDPECAALPWDKSWTTTLMKDIPKQLNWNAMRVCVGIAPKFWYDIADEAGLLLQNEWLYWQNHGWDEQIRAEYTDWVWSDGNHPSIAIWDAINENWDSYIGNTLIPELKKLDPTRLWDVGYMTAEHMALDEMDEPHPYQMYGMREDFDEYYTKNPFPLGDLQHRTDSIDAFRSSSAVQLVNEYAWIWLWRDGRPAKLTERNFAFSLGKDASPEQRFEMQAYWFQLETEWLRAERAFAGVLGFCYLTNNYGFTGDWFEGSVKDLHPSPTLNWQQHCFAPSAVFIDLTDERYTRHLPPRQPGSWMAFNLVGVNDYDAPVSGDVVVKMLDSQGSEVNRRQISITIPPYGKQIAPIAMQIPNESGGYLMLAEFTPNRAQTPSPVLSRRYLKVGEKDRYEWFEYKPEELKR